MANPFTNYWMKPYCQILKKGILLYGKEESIREF